MLDAIDRRAEQEAVAVNNLRKYQIGKHSKPILYNSIARAGEMPATIIKKSRVTKQRAVKITVKKEIPVFSLGD